MRCCRLVRFLTRGLRHLGTRHSQEIGYRTRNSPDAILGLADGTISDKPYRFCRTLTSVRGYRILLPNMENINIKPIWSSFCTWLRATFCWLVRRRKCFAAVSNSNITTTTTTTTTCNNIRYGSINYGTVSNGGLEQSLGMSSYQRNPYT